VTGNCAPDPTSKLTKNVKDYGAKGDGTTDDTAAIQAAVNAVAGTGGTVLIPDGTYLVNAVVQNSMGIRLGSSMTLSLSSGAVLQAKPNASANYAILAVYNASNVNIVGGSLLGERNAHQGTSGEYGNGISITNSQHVVIQGVTASECWGDGFYVTGNASSDVTLCGVVADHNRRQGLTITSGTRILVQNSIFRNSAGVSPERGIDIEPNSGDAIDGVLITGCTLTNNAGGGFQCGTVASNATATNLVFDQNTVYGNGLNPVGTSDQFAVKVTTFSGTQITNNQVSNNVGGGILVDSATDTLVQGNTVTGSLQVSGNAYFTGVGIEIEGDCSGSTITQNTVTGNAGAGIFEMNGASFGSISSNIVSGNNPNWITP
jgi:parallel beta-helix repeat protein